VDRADNIRVVEEIRRGEFPCLRAALVSSARMLTKRTYVAFLGWDAILDPNAVRSHHVRHHRVGQQSIADDNNLRGRGDVDIFLEDLHNLIATARLFDAVTQHLDSGILLENVGSCIAPIMMCSSGIRNDQQTRTWICLSELLELVAVRGEDIIVMRDCKAIVLVEYHGANVCLREGS